MKITNALGTMNFNDEDIPSIDDMNDIIASLTESEEEFLDLGIASCDFSDDLTTEQFVAECNKWIAANRK